MNNSQVAHIWAQQNKESGKGSNFFFEGATIYSYGYHFPIARFIDNNTVLFTTDGYSVTTSQHISRARSAVSHKTVFMVPDVEATTKTDHRANYTAMLETIQEEAKSISRARASIEWRIGYLNGSIDSLNDYTKRFKLGKRAFPQFAAGTIKADFKAIIEKERKAAVTKVRKDRAATKKELLLWLDNKPASKQVYAGAASFSRIYGTDFLRVKQQADLDKPYNTEAETNQGARVPLEHCKKAWPIIKAYCEKGREFTPNGKTIHLGPFAIDRISKSGTVRAGCHTFRYSELLRFAKVLGLEK